MLLSIPEDQVKGSVRIRNGRITFRLETPDDDFYFQRMKTAMAYVTVPRAETLSELDQISELQQQIDQLRDELRKPTKTDSGENVGTV